MWAASPGQAELQRQARKSVPRLSSFRALIELRYAPADALPFVIRCHSVVEELHFDTVFGGSLRQTEQDLKQNSCDAGLHS